MRDVKTVCATLAVVALAAAPAPRTATAMHATGGPEIAMRSEETPLGFSMRGSMGYLNGNANRATYAENPDGSRRQLTSSSWDLRGLFMLGCEATAEVMDRIRINAGLWKAMNEGSGETDEYRWLWIGHEWSHWQHGSVDVINAFMFDINASLDLVNYQGILLSALAGLRRDSFAWLDSALWYTETKTTFRDVHGTYNGQNTIGYRQDYWTPYAGGDARASFGPADVELYLLFSPVSIGSDLIHYKNRENKTFPQGLHVESGPGLGGYIAAGGRGLYNVTDNLFAGAGLDVTSQTTRNANRKTIETNEVLRKGTALSQSAVMLTGVVGWRF